MFEREDYELFDDPDEGRQLVHIDKESYFTMPHGTPDRAIWKTLDLMRRAYNLGVASGRLRKTRELQRALNPNNE